MYTVDANGSQGIINGTVSGGVLTFTWNQDGGFTGTGSFTLAPDGGTFAGGYRSDPNPALTPDLLVGTWQGQRR
jgi:hypothetical protein